MGDNHRIIDYHLQLISAAIDGGTATGVSDHDAYPTNALTDTPTTHQDQWPSPGAFGRATGGSSASNWDIARRVMPQSLVGKGG